MKSLLTLLLCGLIFTNSLANAKGPKGHFEAGLESLQKQELIRAVSEFTMAIDLNPNFAEAYFQRAVVKNLLAEKVGFSKADVCFDFAQAYKLGLNKAAAMMQESCLSECYTIEGAKVQPELVFCGEFAGSDLKDLPDNINQLENLVKLDLSVNNFSTLSDKFNTINENIMVLDISNNMLTEVNPLASFTELRDLNLSNNKIKSLPEIGQLTQLQSLSLKKNNLTSLPASLENLKNLEILDLSFNQITSLPAGIKHLKSLKELRLQGNPLTLAQVKELKKALPHCNILY